MPSKNNSGGSSAGMTPEMQKAKMSEERAFLTNLFESALGNKGQEVHRLLLTYGLEHQILAHKVLGEFKDGSGRTALHFACQSQVVSDVDDNNDGTATTKDEKKDDKDSLDIVELLLTRCKFPSNAVISLLRMKDKDGLTPLMLASQNPNYKRIKCIVGIGGSKVTLARSKTGATALHYAAGAGASKEVIEELYENGKAALTSSSLQGGTPLHWVSGTPPSKDYGETVLALLKCGADIDAPNEGGISALILAVAAGNDSHAKILIQHGADRGVILGGNVTVYHIAADLNLVGTLAALLEIDSGRDKDSITSTCLKKKNDKGQTPLDLAVKEGHLGCVMLLMGEQDEAVAKEQMTKAQKTMKEEEVKAPEEVEEEETKQIVDQNDGLSEEDAQQKAALLLSNATDISEEAKSKAAEYKAQGNDYFKKKEYDQAIDAYTTAIEYMPTEATYYSNRSACYMAIKKYEKALEDGVMARALKPDWPKACYRMAVARMALDRFEDAAVSAWEGLQKDDNNSELKELLQKCVRRGRKDHFQKKDEKSR